MDGRVIEIILVQGCHDLARGDPRFDSRRHPPRNNMNDVNVRIGHCGFEDAVSCRTTGTEDNDIVNARRQFGQWRNRSVVGQQGNDTRQVEHREQDQWRKEYRTQSRQFHGATV